MAHALATLPHPVRPLGCLAVLQALALPWAKEKVTESLKGPRGGESLAQVLSGAWKSGGSHVGVSCTLPLGQRLSQKGQGSEGGVRMWAAGSL